MPFFYDKYVRLLLFTSLSLSGLQAKHIYVDSRGGADYTTLAGAALVVEAGDTIVIAEGSGPYRESLQISVSGTSLNPIIVEGNGVTITGAEPLNFTQSNGVWTARLPFPYPVVVMKDSRRVLEVPGNAFIGPIRLWEDNRMIELLGGASPEGWEASKRASPVVANNVSYHVYRNIVAEGGYNDGFNLHGSGEGIRFENIVGCNNLDEGFSAHNTISSEIVGGEFWGNDNGIANANASVSAISNVDVYDNLGWGIWLFQDTVAEMSDVRFL